MSEFSILAVGTEMLRGARSDSNSRLIVRRMLSLGMTCREIAVVPDSVEAIGRRLLAFLNDAHVVILTGGLGPTHDDVTRQAVARALGLPLQQDERYPTPVGAERLISPLGKAPGIFWSARDKAVVALPGVPEELEAMLPAVERRLRERLGGTVTGFYHVRTLVAAGVSESDVSRLLPADPEARGLEVTILASPASVSVDISCRHKNVVGAVDSLFQTLVGALGDAVFSHSHDETLSSRLGTAALKAGTTVGVAESFTGGDIASLIVDTPGASAYFAGGLVAYSDRAKQAILGVPEELIRRNGAVSAQVAVEMAKGAVASLGCDTAVSTTGIAGPSGGSRDKPVGLLYIGLAAADSTRALEYRLDGSRRYIRSAGATLALHHLRLFIIEVAGFV